MNAGRAALVAAFVLVATAAVRAEPMRPFPGSMPRALAGMVSVGPAPADLALGRVTVVLGLRDRDELDAVIAAQQDPRSPRFGRWLDLGEIAERFGPRREHYERVRRWLVGQGFTVVYESRTRIALGVAGDAALAGRALAAPIHLFRHGDRLYHGPSTAPCLPESLAVGVEGIVGLDDLPAFRPLARIGDQLALGPADVTGAYGVAPLHAAGVTGAGRQIAVVARSDFNESDVSEFSDRFGARVSFTRKFVGDPPGILPGDGEETEVLIDTQWAGALAPGTHVNVIISSRQGDIPEALAEAVEKREGDVVTISFGACEPAASLVVTQLFDAFYAIANAQGQTVLVASGDGGATECGLGDSILAVNALASSPHAIAVGGTSFELEEGGALPSPLVERVWNDRFGASGGGESAVFARPRYQLATLPAVRRGRALPDVALPASPASPGYFIVQDGNELIVGGTSVGAPVLASMLTLVSERLGTAGLGQLVPTLYRLGAEQTAGLRPPVFRDVVDGDNAAEGVGGFAAGAGFDLATGWGTPMADALAGALGGPGRCEPEIDCLVPGRGARQTACHAEWLVERGSPELRSGDVLRVRQHCRDGDPECDADGVVDGRCVMRVALCLNVFDYRRPFLGRQDFPVCGPVLIQRVRVGRVRGTGARAQVAASRQALRAAVRALPLPTDLQAACTATLPVDVPIRAGHTRGRLTLKAHATRAGAGTTARLSLRCEAAQ